MSPTIKCVISANNKDNNFFEVTTMNEWLNNNFPILLYVAFGFLFLDSLRRIYLKYKDRKNRR